MPAPAGRARHDPVGSPPSFAGRPAGAGRPVQSAQGASGGARGRRLAPQLGIPPADASLEARLKVLVLLDLRAWWALLAP
ncbi:hypothetical protein, partial [Frankia sp. CiP3]|uniref:hypothetical protein n=1 Tax=Frankia sp. CiP3 TaxID=2880971 RepID=UPI001EF5E3E6